jgi:hypothetical protein
LQNFLSIKQTSMRYGQLKRGFMKGVKTTSEDYDPYHSRQSSSSSSNLSIDQGQPAPKMLRNQSDIPLKSISSSKRDITLKAESRDVCHQYPFVSHKSEIYPINTRIRSTLRTLDQFGDKNKLNMPSPEEIAQIQAAKNPYQLNRNVRKKTKNSFNEPEVEDVLKQNGNDQVHLKQKA